MVTFQYHCKPSISIKIVLLVQHEWTFIIKYLQKRARFIKNESTKDAFGNGTSSSSHSELFNEELHATLCTRPNYQ